MVSRRDYLRGSGVAASLLVAGCTSEGEADYPNEEIETVVPYSPGGGFDTYTRGLAEYMPQHLPNEVEMPVVNEPGAGGMNAMVSMYNEDPDGYKISMFNGNTFLNNWFFDDDPSYEIREYSWIGQMARSSHIMVVGADSPYETLEDLQAAEESVRFGTSGPQNSLAINAYVSSAVMDFPMEMVTGYAGTSEIATAIVRGDIVGLVGPTSSLASSIESGDLRPLVVYDEAPYDFAPDLESVFDKGFDELAAIAGTMRLIGAPPDVESDRLDVLRSAFTDTLESDELAEWSERQERPLNYVSGSDVANGFNEAIDLLGEYEDVINSYIE